MPDFIGNPGPDNFTGGAGPDSFFLQQGGDDSANGADGSDGFFFGGALTQADSVDGGAGLDTLAVQGNYSAGLVLGDIRNVETMLLLSGADTSFGETGANRYNYAITTSEANIAAGQVLTVIATGLQSNENLVFRANDSDGALRLYAGAGTDRLTGGGGSDGFFFGADLNLTGADSIHGGLGTDSVALRGDYFSPGRAIVFQDDSLVGIEVLALLSGHTNEYSGVIVPGGYDYDVTMADGDVDAGAHMDINAGLLGADETLRFDGSREANGFFRIFSGAGNDTLIGSSGGDLIYGSLGADTLTGHGGNDIFLIRAVGESTSAATDSITDFGIGDVIDFSFVDANSQTNPKEHFTFIGAAGFGGHAGELRAVDTGNGNWRVEGDVDGNGAADLAINVHLDPGYFLASDGSTIVASAVTPIIAEAAAANDTFGTAQNIERNALLVAPNVDLVFGDDPSATIRGTIATASDVDYYKIDLVAGEGLILDVDHIPQGTLDPVIKVYDPIGALIWVNKDGLFEDPGSDPLGAYPVNSPRVTDPLVGFRALTSGTYTFTIEAVHPANPADTTTGSYDIQVTVAPQAPQSEIDLENIESLNNETQWGDSVLTVGFPTSASDYSSYNPATMPEPYHGFQPLNPDQQAAASLALGAVASFTNLDFILVTSNPGTATLRYAMTSAIPTAEGYFPNDNAFGGDSWFNSDGTYSNPLIGNYAYATFLHETGHALGLKHGHSTPLALGGDRDSLEYSVMTYHSFPDSDAEAGYPNETFGYPQSYMMYDIAALQDMYGAYYGLNSGDTVYQWNANTGQMFINGLGQIPPGANRVFMTIWDGGGNDTYDLSNYTNAVTIDLRPGEWTITSPVQLANLGEGHFARGNVANSLLYQGDPRSLIENAIGGAGNDTLIANQAVNHLAGLGGADTFVWTQASDSRAGASADTIDLFQNGIDHIDLSRIDADSRTVVQDHFHWIGGNAFTGGAGELRGEVIAGSLHILGDLNADGMADFELILAGQPTIVDSSTFNL